MSDSENFTNANSTLPSTITGEIAVASVIIVFVIFAVALILYLRLKGYSGTIGLLRSPSHRLIFTQRQFNALNQSLDPSILRSLAVTVFRSEDFKEVGGIQCAVCLAELVDGEKARFLPKCKHGFHVVCIDMWFHSNNTCPLCRNLVVIDSVSENEHLSESKNVEANFEEGGSSSEIEFSDKIRKGTLVTEIHTQVIEGQGIKLPASERLMSLRKILSRET